MVAGGAIFFVYALRLVLQGHPGVYDRPHERGLRSLLLPYVVSPLAMTSIIVLAERDGWRWSAIMAVAYLAVVAINLLTTLALTYMVHWIPRILIEVAGRIMGLLLAPSDWSWSPTAWTPWASSICPYTICPHADDFQRVPRRGQCITMRVRSGLRPTSPPIFTATLT